jgi:acetyl-CoA carboxylase biotin carboxyl carrier protein
MEFEKIKELIKLVQKSKISEFKYENETTKFSIRTKNFSTSKEVIVQPPMVHSMPVGTVGNGPQLNGPQPSTETAAVQVKDEAGENENAQNNNYVEIKSPMVGTFYRSPSPDKPVFVKVGDVISVDDTVCLIEAMKLFNDVKAEVGGKIVKVMVEDASPVEYGQVLFLVEPV